MSGLINRAAAGIVAATMTLSCAVIEPAQAAPIGDLRAAAGSITAPSDVTNVSWRQHGYYGRNNAAAFATFAAIAGTALAIAAAQRHRHDYGYYSPYGDGYGYPYQGPRYYPY